MKEIITNNYSKISVSDINCWKHLIIGFINNKIHGVILQDKYNKYQYNIASREGSSEIYGYESLETLINHLYNKFPTIKFYVVNEQIYNPLD